MERKKRSKGSVWEFCYANKIFGTYGFEIRAYGQKLVKFCAHTHTTAAKFVVRMDPLIGPSLCARTQVYIYPCKSSDDIMPSFLSPETTGPNRSYAMKIEPTDASLRNGLLGEYEMNVRGADVVLRKVGHKMAYIQWPIAHIRSFKSHGTSGTDLLTLDANM